MPIRKWILLSFFALLGFHVLVGCYGLANRVENIFFRGLANTIVLAIGCLLLYPASWLGLLKRTKWVSWAAMALLCLEVVLLLVFFWVVDQRGFGLRRLDDFIAVSIVISFFSGLVIMLGLYMLTFKTVRCSAHCLIGSTIVVVVLLTLANYHYELLGVRNSQLGNSFAQSSALVGCFGIGLAFLLAGPWYWYKMVGVLAGVCSTLLFWLDFQHIRVFSGSNMWQVGSSTSLAVLLAYTNLIWTIPVKDRWVRLIRFCALGFVIVGCVIVLYQCYDPPYLHGHPVLIMMRVIGILTFIVICMTFVIGFKATADAIKIRRTDLPAQFNYTQLQIQCPHCSTPQLLTEAGQCCLQCGLQFHFRITEPHCVNCDYLLIGQSSGCCPECGHAIASNSGQAITAASI